MEISMQTEFDARLEAARTNATNTMRNNRLKTDTAIDYELRKDSQVVVSKILTSLYDLLGFDEEKLDFAIKMARRSEYGRISELITHVAKLYAWPIQDVADVKDIDPLQEEILDHLVSEYNITLTHDLLLDIKEAKGSHTFLAKDTYEVVDAQAPEFDELGFYLRTFAEYAGMPIIDYKLTESQWNRNENKAITKVNAEHEKAQQALEAHNALESA